MKYEFMPTNFDGLRRNRNSIRGIGVLLLLCLLLGASSSSLIIARGSNVADPETLFFEGYVVHIQDNTLIVANDEQSSALFITKETRLWKEEVTSLSQVEIGDFVYALSLPEKNGQFIATKVWVNIANFYGEIVETDSTGFMLRLNNQKPDTLLTVYTKTNTLLNDEYLSNDALNHIQGELAQVLGVYQHDGTLIATRVWTSSVNGNMLASCNGDLAGDSKIAGDDSDTQSSGPFIGTASWFCCGSSYGPCGAAGGGSCGGCQSGQYHAAWPKLQRSVGNCDYSGCNMSLPWKSCDSLLRVRSKCNWETVWVTIKDCGPAQTNYCNMGVTCGSCDGFCSALVDLTPRSFSRIANLDLGRIPVEVFP